MNFLVDDFKGWSKLDYSWLLISTLSIVLITMAMGGSTISIISAIANIVCVILVAKGKLSNYVWGIVGVITYAYMAYNWGYYGETMLNALYYLPMQFIGFYMWRKSLSENNDPSDTKTVIGKKLQKHHKILLVILVPIIIFMFSELLIVLGGQLTLLDATTTILSVTAMMFMVLRLKEQWYLWIIVDIISIYMWFVAYSLGNVDGIATLLMWIVFTINAFYGLYEWNNREKMQLRMQYND